ncbi:DUF7577 domain-containing protein [Natronobeatus ordinarius]|uniref:DUF7577 domain-containing protein n=1 Tax=Natronobeatus ordinarius TaxID=2963433 RepID=UPI0020CCD8AC|nr:hypothetical protein [Natronobeatus ordinarius]
MELWGWLVGYVILFALFHLVLYYVYVRREGDDGSRSPSPSLTDGNGTGAQYASSPDRFAGPTDDADTDADIEFDGETIRCPHCGLQNEADQTFTYCWNCISTLRQ